MTQKKTAKKNENEESMNERVRINETKTEQCGCRLRDSEKRGCGCADVGGAGRALGRRAEFLDRGDREGAARSLEEDGDWKFLHQLVATPCS